MHKIFMTRTYNINKPDAKNMCQKRHFIPLQRSDSIQGTDYNANDCIVLSVKFKVSRTKIDELGETLVI